MSVAPDVTPTGVETAQFAPIEFNIAKLALSNPKHLRDGIPKNISPRWSKCDNELPTRKRSG